MSIYSCRPVWTSSLSLSEELVNYIPNMSFCKFVYIDLKLSEASSMAQIDEFMLKKLEVKF